MISKRMRFSLYPGFQLTLRNFPPPGAAIQHALIAAANAKSVGIIIMKKIERMNLGIPSRRIIGSFLDFNHSQYAALYFKETKAPRHVSTIKIQASHLVVHLCSFDLRVGPLVT